jgi:hypothetical protein
MQCKIFFFLLFFCHCGYHFSHQDQILKKTHQIERLYIKPIQNKTLRAGIEAIAHKQIFSLFSQDKRIQLVSQENLADASLAISIEQILIQGIAESSVSTLSPQGVGDSLPTAGFAVFTNYAASLDCSFQLIKKTKPIWKENFNRRQNFASSIQLGTPGTSSQVIHETEIERVLNDICSFIGTDAKDAMMSLF